MHLVKEFMILEPRVHRVLKKELLVCTTDCKYVVVFRSNLWIGAFIK